MRFQKNGIRNAAHQFSEEDIQTLQEHWKEHLKEIPRYPKRKYEGRGIVYTAGGLKYTTCAWVSISTLRKSGCTLPIEFWYVGNEISEEVILEFKELDVEFRNFNAVEKIGFHGYVLKPLAILNSRFEEVLFLDADNNCVKDPTSLFSFEEYQRLGSMFWPDYWRTSRSNPIWKITDVNQYQTYEQESGQILINKKKCWKELNLCLYFNKLGKYYYRILLGDKDTFRFAWLAMKSAYYMIPHSVGTCGYEENGSFYGVTMVQHGPAGDIYFLHRNLLKWDITHKDEFIWEKIKTFHHGKGDKRLYFKNTKENNYALDMKGAVREADFATLFPGFEQQCLDFLQNWRSSATYKNFLEYCYFANERYRTKELFKM